MLIVVWFVVILNLSSITEDKEIIHKALLYEAQQNRMQIKRQQEENVAYWKKINPNNVDQYIEWEKQATKNLPKSFESKN